MNKFRLMSIAIVVTTMATHSDPASAGWGSYGSYGSSGGSYGSSGGSYGSYGSSGYTSYYGSSGSYGSSGGYGSSGHHAGLFARLKARIHAHHSYASSGGSWGSSGGSSGGYASYSSYGSYGSSGGSSGSSGGSVVYYGGGSSGGSSGGIYHSYSASSGGSSGGSVGSYYQATPVYSQPVDVHSGEVYHNPSTEVHHSGVVHGSSYQVRSSTISKDSARLTMNVPQDAEIYVNGKKTKSTGTSRQFVSRGMDPGHAYGYEVRVEMVVDGRPVSKVENVRLRGGDSRTLTISADSMESAVVTDDSQEQPVETETELTINVPEDAKVTLAGNVTRATGSTRVFRTKQLKPGEVWDNYTIHVAIERDGQLVSKTKQISLEAGSDRELTFDFADAKVAMR